MIRNSFLSNFPLPTCPVGCKGLTNLLRYAFRKILPMKYLLGAYLLWIGHICFAQHPCQEYFTTQVKPYFYEETIPLSANPQEYRIIMVGERHFVPINTDIHFALIRSYHEMAELDVVFIEYPPSISYFIQQYLESGKEDLLVKAFQGAPYATYNQALFKKIRLLNQKIQSPIQVIGLDLEVGGLARPKEIIRQLAQHFPAAKAQKDLQSFLVTFEEDRATASTQESFLRVYDHFRKKRKKLKKSLGNSFIHLDLVMQNLKNYIPVNPDEMFDMAFQIKRDSFMYHNLLLIEQEQSFKQAYLAMGATHVEKLTDNNHRRLSHYLAYDPDSPGADRLLTARINYKGFKQDAAGYELRFQEFLDNTGLSEASTKQLFGSSQSPIGVVEINDPSYTCEEKKTFDTLIYLRAKE